MTQKFSELIHKDIEEVVENWFGPQSYGFEFMLTYDIDYDMSKLRFWKPKGIVVVSKKYNMPSFANPQQLIEWLNSRLVEFARWSGEEKPYVKGYIRG